MKRKFMVGFVSDLDYEEMVADICYEESQGIHRTVAMITQEKGMDEMKIEIYPPSEGLVSWTLPLDDFIDILQFSKKSLIEMRKSPED